MVDFVIMGLPASGKTTFLAALWHIIEADETECRLKLGSYEGDLKYLNSIAAAWRTFKEVPRTNADIDITIQFTNTESNDKSTAFFPDLAGETFDLQVEQRQCRAAFIKNVHNDDGILFFISTDIKEDDLSVVELNKRLPPPAVGPQDEAPVAATGVEPDTKDGDVLQTETPVREWAPKDIPEQVRIVQLLSDFLRPPFFPRRRKVGIILSAWDLARSMGLAPDEWLARNLPLVDQFLRSNREFFAYKIYGVSAQGVNLEIAAEVTEAVKLTPSHRVQVVAPEGESHDITAPLVWLMSADAAMKGRA